MLLNAVLHHSQVIRISCDNRNLVTTENIKSAMTEYYKKVSTEIYQYGAPTLIIVGTISNVLMIIVLMASRKMRSQTNSVYLTCLAVLDIIILNTGLLRHYIKNTKDYDIRLQSTAACRLHIFIVYFTIQFESWVLVNLTLERLLAVMLPHKLRIIFSKKKAAIYLFITGIILFTLNLHYFFFFHIRNYSDAVPIQMCLNDVEYTYFYDNVWAWLDLLFASLIPFMVIFISNIMIIIRVILKKRLAKTSGSSFKMTNMTASLLVVSFLFLLTTSPICIFLLINFDMESEEEHFYVSMIFDILNLIYYINNSINFFLYCITSRRFRQQFLIVFKIRSARVSTETSASFTMDTA